MIEREELKELYWNSMKHVNDECEEYSDCDACPLGNTWCELMLLTRTAINSLHMMKNADTEIDRAGFFNEYKEASSKIEQLKSEMGI